MGWLAIGIKVAQVALAAFNITENTQTPVRGGAKYALAHDIMSQMLGSCEGDAAVRDILQNGSDDERKALRDYADAYVKLQNVIAKRSQKVSE